MADQPAVPMAELDFDPASYATYYQGEPFTGEARDYSADGVLMEVTQFRDGYRHGPSRTLYPNGALHSEGMYEFNQPAGTDRTWYPDGRLREESVYEGGRLVAHRRWDEDGVLVESSEDG